MKYYIAERVLFYNDLIKEAIKKLNKDNSFVVIEDRFRNSKPVLGLNHYQALLLVYTLGKIEGRDYRLLDSLTDEDALRMDIQKDAENYWNFRSEIVAYNYNDPCVKKLLKDSPIDSEYYPVVIRNPDVMVDRDSIHGFRYSIGDKTAFLWGAETSFLKIGGNFYNDDEGLGLTGFPFSLSGEGNRTLRVGNRYTSISAVVRTATFDIHADIPPNKPLPLTGVRILEIQLTEKAPSIICNPYS